MEKSKLVSSNDSSSEIPPCSPERFKELCIRPSFNEATTFNEISSLLDFFFNPIFFLNRSLPNVKILKNYIAGGSNFDAFKARVKSFDSSSTCGMVWNVSYVAYRCRTCALSPCMSICAECFQNGDHRGHDYNMFRSGAGGACDCGDEYVMNPKGFCKTHGCKIQSTSINQPPEELIKCCDIIIAHLLYSFVQAFRKIYSSFDFKLPQNRAHLTSALSEIMSYIEMINELVSLGTPLRNLIVNYIVDSNHYTKKIDNESSHTRRSTEISKSSTMLSLDPLVSFEAFNFSSTLTTGDRYQPTEENRSNEEKLTAEQLNARSQKTSYFHSVFKKALDLQQPIQVPRSFTNIAECILEIKTKTIVDELLFWCIIFEFPEPLVKFLVSLLPDNRYKNYFVRSFVSQYSYISVILLQSRSEHICSRVVHISVQLFSNEATAIKALEECYLLPILLSTLHNMLVSNGLDNDSSRDTLLIRSKLEDELKNNHFVLDPDHSIMQENLYWLVTSDLVNLLNHNRVAFDLVTKTQHIEIWFDIVACFQAMNMSIRKFGEHVSQEQPTYFSAFSAELECCSAIMWSIVQYLTQTQKSNNSKSLMLNPIHINLKLVKIVFERLRKWLNDIGFMTSLVVKRPNYKHLSFHLPLHRYLACFIYNGISVHSIPLKSLLETYFSGSSIENKQYLLANILAHPLQLQIGFYEIHANMWVRNGMQMKGQAMTYVQNHFCSSFSDADFFLIQVLASELDPDLFMNAFVERFHLLKWLRKCVYERHCQVRSKIKSFMNKDNKESDEDEDENSEFELDFEDSEKISDGYIGQDDLEPSHEIAMLVGALTLLSQIITIRANLRLKSYLLTRTELIYILAVADRTYSQIEENLPDACSLSVSKRLVSPLLEQISDFLQPTLDTSIGSLKQGRYKPKDHIWLTEYDPLYVMLRSVRRREFQESFDRYLQIVEQKMSKLGKHKKNIWPPFRIKEKSDGISIDEIRKKLQQPSQALEDTPIDLSYEIEANQRLECELDGRWNILNTKIIHSIIINILYDHYYRSPITEKVLYFVVFLLELSIHRARDRKSQSTKGREAAKEEQVIFDDYNYKTWFRGNDLVENLCTYVPFITCNFNEVEFDQSNRADIDESNKLVPPSKKKCSGLDSFDTKESELSTKRVSRLSNRFKKSYLCESILSLLVKLMYASKKTEWEKENSENGKSDVFILEMDFSKGQNLDEEFYETRVGNENDFIVNVLEKAAALDRKCDIIMKKTLETLNNPNEKQNKQSEYLSSLSTKTNERASALFQKNLILNDEDLKSKKIKAKARQQKLLAQMSTCQKAFLLNPNNKMDVEAFNEMQSTLNANLINKSSTEISSETFKTDTNLPNTFAEQANIKQNDTCSNLDKMYDCCICRLSSVSTLDRPIGIVALIQSTSVLAHRESTKSEMHIRKLPVSDDFSYEELSTPSLCWREEQYRLENMKNAFNKNSCKYSINIGWKGGIYTQTCGHYLHFDCYYSYKNTLEEQPHQMTRISTMEYTCPLCRQIANCVLPVRTNNSTIDTNEIHSTIQVPFSSDKQTSAALWSNSNTTPAKVWLLSSIASKNRNDFEKNFVIGSNNNKPIKNEINIDSNTFSRKTLKHRDEIKEFENSIHEEILEMMNSRPLSLQDMSNTSSSHCKNEALSVITQATPIEFRYIDHSSLITNPHLYRTESPADHDITLFTSSVLRTQLEIDLLLLKRQKEHLNTENKKMKISNSFNFKKKRECFVPLFDVITTNCRLMCHEQKPHLKIWSALINQTSENSLSNTSDKKKSTTDVDLAINEFSSKKSIEKNIQRIEKIQEVPLLLRDPIAILLFIISNMTIDLNESHFDCIAYSVYRLGYFQSVIDLCNQFDYEERQTWAANVKTNLNEKTLLIHEFGYYVAKVIDFLDSSQIFQFQREKIEEKKYFMKTIWTNESAKIYVETKCNHLLAISALLKAYLFDQDITEVCLYNVENIKTFLGWNSENYFNYSKIKFDNISTIQTWLDDLIKAFNVYPQQVQNLLCLGFNTYAFPQLLELPKLYSDLFSYYLNKRCQFCSRIPRETAVCLVCGTQICYKSQYCCDEMKEFNKRHTNICGAGTLILLNINSTYVFIIRSKRCAAWASLYLDDHGEEDRDLRRGKPLYLNEQRYNLLKSSWCSHSFDYQSLKWYSTSMLIY